MLTINLISQELKNEIKLRHIYDLFKKINYTLALVVIVSAIALLVSKIMLQNNFNRIVAETTLVTKNSQSYNTKVREINSKFKSVSRIQDDYVPWSYLLDDLAAMSPDGVDFSSIKISRQDRSFRVSGHARERSGLLALKEAMENGSVFKDMDFPLKNILQKENVDFEIKSGIDIKELEKSINNALSRREAVWSPFALSHGSE